MVEKMDLKDTVTLIDVAYVARLARLHLNAEELPRLQEQLNQIARFVRKIGELDLQAVEPTSRAGGGTNVFRADEAQTGLDRDTALKNAPAHAQGLFLVPKVVE